MIAMMARRISAAMPGAVVIRHAKRRLNHASGRRQLCPMAQKMELTASPSGVNRPAIGALNQSRCASSWNGEQSGPEQVKVRSAVHLSFHELELRDLAFGLTVGPWLDDGGADCRAVRRHTP